MVYQRSYQPRLGPTFRPSRSSAILGKEFFQDNFRSLLRPVSLIQKPLDPKEKEPCVLSSTGYLGSVIGPSLFRIVVDGTERVAFKG